jgi:hypothetical protein
MRKKKRFCAFFSTVALRIDRRRSNSAIRFDKLSIQVCIHFCIASCALRSPTEQNRFLVDVFGFHHRNEKMSTPAPSATENINPFDAEFWKQVGKVTR